MSADIAITKHAADKHGMTFAELREFVQSAMKNDVPDDAVVSCRVTFGGKARQLTVAAPQHRAGQEEQSD